MWVSVLAAAVVTTACGTSPIAPSQASPAAGGAVPGGASTAASASGPSADVQISGSASTGSPNAGASYGYTFQVKNAGPSTATGASFTNTLPAGVTFLGATVNGAAGACQESGGLVTCALGDLASGGQTVIVLSLGAQTTVGTYADTGSATSSVPDSNTGNNSVTVTIQVKAPSTDTIKVTKCYTNGTATSGGEMLIKAASSDTTARLFAYRPDGTLIGELQNGGGSRYGGTVMPYQPYDPVNVTIRSSSGGSITVPTTPFQI
jgi:uncharacterized repeat protein (TIGR01451 family)